MTTAIPIQSAAMLQVVHVRSSGPVGARSSLYRLDSLASDLIRSSSARLFTARSLNSSRSIVLPSSASQHAGSLRSPAYQHAPAFGFRFQHASGLYKALACQHFSFSQRKEKLTSHPQGGVLTACEAGVLNR